MEDKNYSIIKDYGSLSEQDNGVRFRLVNWGGFPKYDLRKWSEDGTPFKGIVIKEDELESLLNCLKSAVDRPLSLHAKKTLQIGPRTIQVLDIWGPFGKSGNWEKYVTYTNWGGSPKIDVRVWPSDFSTCGKGVTLSDPEAKKLINILNVTFFHKSVDKKESSKTSVDTKEIDDLLL